MSRTERIKEIFKSGGIMKVVGAHDGLSAKLVEKNGFDGIWASGLEISTSYAVPDANILTMSQNLERACEIVDATTIPVIADCDTGYGNSNNVIYMVKKYKAAGISAVCIEDKKFPKVNSLISGRQELVPVSEFVGKIMAAKNAQETEDFMVIARIEALIAGYGQEEAIKRAQAYVGAGADAILIHSKSDKNDEIKQFCKLWNKRSPVVIIPTTYPDIPEDEMKKLGIQMVIYANLGIRASIKAMDEVFSTLKNDGNANIAKKTVSPMSSVFEIQGMGKMKEQEKIYLKSHERTNQALILAAGRPSYQKDLLNLLTDVPPALLDINGKSLLERNVETLSASGVNNISLVAGYLSEKIDVDGIEKIVNKDFDNTYILESLMKAEHKLNDALLVCYGDIIFDRTLIDQLLKYEDDIVLVIDPEFKKVKKRNKILDLVIAEHKPMIDTRALSKKSNPVREIGVNIDEKKADYEFIGMFLLSKKGANDLKEAYHKAKKKYGQGAFQNAKTFKMASVTDIINEMIRDGYKVETMEVHSGWMEMHSFANYKKACAVLK